MLQLLQRLAEGKGDQVRRLDQADMPKHSLLRLLLELGAGLPDPGLRLELSPPSADVHRPDDVDTRWALRGRRHHGWDKVHHETRVDTYPDYGHPLLDSQLAERGCCLSTCVGGVGHLLRGGHDVQAAARCEGDVVGDVWDPRFGGENGNFGPVQRDPLEGPYDPYSDWEASEFCDRPPHLFWVAVDNCHYLVRAFGKITKDVSPDGAHADEDYLDHAWAEGARVL
jgi:hypothetical protein